MQYIFKESIYSLSILIRIHLLYCHMASSVHPPLLCPPSSCNIALNNTVQELPPDHLVTFRVDEQHGPHTGVLMFEVVAGPWNTGMMFEASDLLQSSLDTFPQWHSVGCIDPDLTQYQGELVRSSRGVGQ